MPVNIRPVTGHRDCWRQSIGEPNWFGRPGDLRRCEHGRLQVRTQVSEHARIQGPGTDWWRDLHPVWTPILWRRAQKAMKR